MALSDYFRATRAHDFAATGKSESRGKTLRALDRALLAYHDYKYLRIYSDVHLNIGPGNGNWWKAALDNLIESAAKYKTRKLVLNKRKEVGGDRYRTADRLLTQAHNVRDAYQAYLSRHGRNGRIVYPYWDSNVVPYRAQLYTTALRELGEDIAGELAGQAVDAGAGLFSFA
jgi:hypothetical protein